MSYEPTRRVRIHLTEMERYLVGGYRLDRSAGLNTPVRIGGFGVAWFPDSGVTVPFWNLVSTAGDQYYCQMGVAGVSPANPATPTKINGMKLGTGANTPTKSGSDAALGAYISGSNAVFDATYPQSAAVAGTDTGWKAIYQTTWAAGTATNSAISEVVIVNDAGTNATSTAANTVARTLLTPAANKTSSQPLVVTWNHIFLGA